VVRSAPADGGPSPAETVTDLLHAIDRRSWEAVRETLAESVQTDYTSLFGGAPQRQSRDALVGVWKALLPGFDTTQHLTGPIRVHEEAGAAHADCAVTATHTLGNDRWVVGGHYEISLSRAGGRWRIDSLLLRTAFVDGTRDLPQRAAVRAAGPNAPG
jgi:hypothetical protein